jgi:hypothetical protein
MELVLPVGGVSGFGSSFLQAPKETAISADKKNKFLLMPFIRLWNS